MYNITLKKFVSDFNVICPNYFSLEALDELYEYLNQNAAMTGERSELSPTRLIRVWHEASAEKLADYFGISTGNRDLTQAVADYLDSKTICIGLTGGRFLYKRF